LPTFYDQRFHIKKFSFQILLILFCLDFLAKGNWQKAVRLKMLVKLTKESMIFLLLL